MDVMVNIGVAGLGMMGRTHLAVYAARPDARVAAVADADPDRLAGRDAVARNIDGQTQGGLDLASVNHHADALALVADPAVDAVDVCLPTPLHKRIAIAALRAGKHVLIEKPLARTADDADAIARAAADCGRIAMCAMCMRFWPGWTWLKRAIDERTFGRVRSAHFRRVASHPGGAFYLDGRASGGAILDLHLHDTDFVQHCFGPPRAVYSRGYRALTSEIDHVVTHYLYEEDGEEAPLIFAEGSWAMAEGFGFRMDYTVNFERATAAFSFDGANHLTLHADGEARAVDLEAGLGYEHEIGYFLDCVAAARPPRRVTLEQAAASVRIVEAEAASVAAGAPVEVNLSAADT